MDLVGHLPPSKGNRYLLTIIDRFTRWPEAIPLSDISGETVANAVVTHWISTFGIPSTVTTDRSTQFTSHLFSTLMIKFGIHLSHTTAYHPIANGMIERCHCQLKASLKAYLASSTWTDILPLILLSFHATVKEDLHCTPAQLVYSTTLRLPGQFFTPSSLADLDPTLYAHRLQAAMQQVCPISP